MGDYFKHWIDIGKHPGAKLPKIFYVNWFRKTADGKWLWPGYGENSRVLKWVLERVAGTGKAEKTAIGYVPAKDALDLTGLKVADEKLLFSVSTEEWKAEIPGIKEHFATFGSHLPKELAKECEDLEKRLNG